MLATKIETTILVDGELHLTQLPVRKGDRVEAIVLCPDHRVDGNDAGDEIAAEKKRQQARLEFLELAKSSAFRSAAPYPSRAELHERH